MSGNPIPALRMPIFGYDTSSRPQNIARIFLGLRLASRSKISILGSKAGFQTCSMVGFFEELTPSRIFALVLSKQSDLSIDESAEEVRREALPLPLLISQVVAPHPMLFPQLLFFLPSEP